MHVLNDFLRRLVRGFNDKGSSGSVFRNMAVLATGSGVARLVGILSIPVISRIYMPEHMGVLSVFVAVTSMLVPFGTMRYSVALPLPKNDGLATNLAVLCISLLFVAAGIVTLFFWLFSRPILEMLSMQALLPYWWLLIISVIGTGGYEILSQWAIREKAFKAYSKTQVQQSLSGAVVKIGLGLLNLKPLGLLVGQIVAQAGGILSLIIRFQHDFRANLQHVTKKRVLFMFKHYSSFPLFRLPSQFLLVFASQAPLLFSAKLFGAEITGQLGLALMALALPMSIFGQTMGQAYYAEIARIGRKNPNKIYELTKSITKKLFLLSILPFLVLLITGPSLFPLVFGEQWSLAGIFASILAFYLLAQFISTPLVNALTVFERQGMFLRINLVRVVGVLVVFGISTVAHLSAVQTMAIYSAALSLHYIFTSVVVFRVIKMAIYDAISI